MSYDVKHNLILHLSMRALLVKSLVTNDNVNSGAWSAGSWVESNCLSLAHYAYMVQASRLAGNEK